MREVIAAEMVLQARALNDLVRNSLRTGSVPLGLGRTSPAITRAETAWGNLANRNGCSWLFSFGGSDVAMLFQDRNITLEAEVGTRCLQGQRIGRVEGR